MNRVIGILVFWMIALGGGMSFRLQANECVKEEPIAKKYQLSVCALFKNEAPYLKEWIEYHRLVGVDHFYLYNNESRDQFLQVLFPYIREGIVTLVHWPDRMPNVEGEQSSHWALSTQVPAYEHALKVRAEKETKWVAFLDIDEFLVPVNANKVSDFLEYYAAYPGVELQSDHFDASEVGVFPTKNLLISVAELTAETPRNVRTSINKTIFKPDEQVSFTWPPYRCNFKDGRSAAIPSKKELRINKYENRRKGALHFGKIQEKLRIDNRYLTEKETKDLLDRGFKIEDQEKVICRFEKPLRKQLGLDTGWEW